MEREIGSEFNKILHQNKHAFKPPIPGSFVFSGRTAIETVLKEIPKVKTALLPSYCCYSMICPFIDRGIKVKFYPVNYKNGLQTELIASDDIDVILWCNYFGFNHEMPDLSSFILNGGKVIEDITHSLLSKVNYHSQSDFLVASIRKWEPIYSGGFCAVKEGELHHVPTTSPPDEYLNLKSDAMDLKSEYLNDYDENKKQTFLPMFEKCNHWLGKHYSGLTIDDWSKNYLFAADVDNHRKIRRRNAHVLYEELKGYVDFLFPEEHMDCPLFVPVLLSDRDGIRKSLIDNQIYCPIHWPKVDYCESNIYEYELSLVCDQRYNEADMERIAGVLKAAL